MPGMFVMVSAGVGLVEGFAAGFAAGFFADLARGLDVVFAAGLLTADRGFAAALIESGPCPIAACDESVDVAGSEPIPGIGFIPCICFIASNMLMPRSSVGVGHPVSKPTAGPPMFATPIISPIVDHSATGMRKDDESRYRCPASR